VSERTGLRAAASAQRERIRAKRKVGFAYRVFIAALGAVVIVAGVILLPFPGPGWLVIFVGLGVLASEFAWAGRLLDYAKKRVGQWSRWVRKQSPAVRVALAIAMLMIVAAALYGYHLWRGLPSWIPGIG